MSEPDHRETIRQFYETEYAEEIQALADEFPEDRSLRLDYADLRAFDQSLAEAFRTSPWETRETAHEVLQEVEPRLMTHDALSPNVRVHNLPEDHEYRVGKYRQQHLGQLLAVRGKVVGTDPVTPFAEVAAYRCAHDDCRNVIRTEQSYGDMVPPYGCPECERSGGEAEFDFDHDESDLVDHQEIGIIPVDTTSEDPPSIQVHLKDDLCDTVDKFYDVTLVGVFDTFPGQKETVLTTYIEAIDLDVEEYAEVDTEEAADLDARIITATRDRQTEGNWGAETDTVVEAVADSNTPEESVRERIDELDRDHSSDLEKMGGDRLSVID